MAQSGFTRRQCVAVGQNGLDGASTLSQELLGPTP